MNKIMLGGIEIGKTCIGDEICKVETYNPPPKWTITLPNGQTNQFTSAELPVEYLGIKYPAYGLRITEVKDDGTRFTYEELFNGNPDSGEYRDMKDETQYLFSGDVVLNFSEPYIIILS